MTAPFVSPLIIRKMRELAKAGETLPAAARTLGVSSGVLRHWAKKYGINFAEESHPYYNDLPLARLHHTMRQLRFAPTAYRNMMLRLERERGES